MSRKAKERIIYDNYDVWDSYSEDAKETLKINGNDNPTEDEIWDMVYEEANIQWDIAKEELEKFFSDDEQWILFGTVGRWNGTYEAGVIFGDFIKIFRKVVKDCDYWKIYDVNGHFYLKCSCHDGINTFEIKKLTQKGIEYYDNWEYGDDNRTEQYVHNQIIKRYSRLPHYMHKVYGCPKREAI